MQIEHQEAFGEGKTAACSCEKIPEMPPFTVRKRKEKIYAFSFVLNVHSDSGKSPKQWV